MPTKPTEIDPPLPSGFKLYKGDVATGNGSGNKSREDSSIPPLPSGFKLYKDPSAPSKPSLLKSVAKTGLDAAKSVGENIYGFYSGVGSAGVDTAVDAYNLLSGQKVSHPKATDPLLKKENLGYKLGYGTERLGEFFTPMGPEIDVARGASLGTKALARGAEAARSIGMIDLVHSGDVGEALQSASFAFAGGAGLSAAFDAMRNPLGSWMAKLARKQYGKILQPTGGKLKGEVANKLLSGGERDIVGRGLTGKSTESMRDQAEQKALEVGKKVAEVYTKLTPGTRVKLKPIFDDLYRYVSEQGLQRDGKLIGKEAGVKVKLALERIAEVTESLGPELESADPEKLRNFRKMLDDSLYKPNAYGQTVKTVSGPADEVKDYLAQSIRRTLNNDPTVGAVNREYHFWQTAYETLKSRTAKDVGKEEFAKKAFSIGRSVTGAIVGEEYGRREGGTEGAILGAVAGMGFSTAVQSVAFRSVSSVVLDRIARMLADGAEYEAAGLALKASAMAAKSPAEKARLVAAGKKYVEDVAKEKAEALAAKKTALAAKKNPVKLYGPNGQVVKP